MPNDSQTLPLRGPCPQCGARAVRISHFAPTQPQYPGWWLVVDCFDCGEFGIGARVTTSHEDRLGLVEAAEKLLEQMDQAWSDTETVW